MSFEPRDYLRHILLEAEYLLNASSGLTFDVSSSDETLQRASVRSIVWDVVRNRIPALHRQVSSLLET